MAKNIRKLNIDRALWGKGALLRDDGKMCCLGHLGAACGVPSEAMFRVYMPDTLYDGNLEKYPSRTRLGNFDEIAAAVNDSNELSMPDKERRLKILFKSRGIDLTFSGKAERF